MVEDLKSSQKLADLLDALHNQGTFDALNNLSTLADAVVHFYFQHSIFTY